MTLSVALAAAPAPAPDPGPIRAAVVAFLVATGAAFLLIGTIGLLRLPNVYNRMHATSKATTLGAASIFLAGFVYYGPQGGGLVSLVGIVFLFLTAPTGAHVISRAASGMGVEFLPGVSDPRERRDEYVGGDSDRRSGDD
ncbi:cation:proton antiporter [Halobacteriales archaeon SW_7_68_16]|nr:MAG: cation:proton antiporter [Halobacteriales archaeon SW_7_68_16]